MNDAEPVPPGRSPSLEPAFQTAYLFGGPLDDVFQHEVPGTRP